MYVAFVNLPLSLSFLVQRSLQYIHKDLTEEFHALSAYPESLSKKVTLLKYFRNYMMEHLLKVIYPSLPSTFVSLLPSLSIFGPLPPQTFQTPILIACINFVKQ